jgi:membrane protease YdiL (CAAX protease family)
VNKETRNLLLFFLATFAATWAAYFAIVFNGWDPYTMPGMVFLLVGGSAPSWVGVLMVLFTYDTEQRRDYFRRCFSFGQIKLPYWAFIVFVFPLVFAVIIALDVLTGGSLPGMTNLKAFIAQPWIIPMALFMSFLSGPWSEEFGWRGYSLDPLLKRFGILRGAAILGFIWGVWHLPLFFMPQTWHGQMGFRFEGFWTFVLFSIGLAMMMTWVYLMTNRSILSGFMMHLAGNFTGNLFHPYSGRVEVMRMVAVLALGLVLCALVERRRVHQPVVVNPLQPKTVSSESTG